MVENQLGLLFGQIAESIRGGLGNIGTMKPNSFPAKIDDIVALIGTGGGDPGGESGSGGALTFASGSFSPSTDGERVTVAHGLGVMPDLVIVQISNFLSFNTYEEAAESQALTAAWGMRSTLGNGQHSGLIETICGLSSTYGIDNMPDKEQGYGYIFCPDENTFQVGCNGKEIWQLYSRDSYKWIAISGMGGTGGTVPDESPEMIYYRGLAESLMTRNAEYLSGDATKMNMKGFVKSDGSTLASLNSYSFAGFKTVKSMSFSDVIFAYENAFLGCESLKIIDITASANMPTVAFLGGSLNGCPNIESIIIRAGESGLNGASVRVEHGGNNTFYVYVPSAYYDAVTANLADVLLPKSRYRKLEDYPEVDKWYETNT